MKKISNKIIIIGGNHHNMLGVVRSLGFKGYKTTVIITNDRPDAFVSKSRYIEKSYIVKVDGEAIMNILLEEGPKLKEKAFIIPTSDFAASLIDENYDQLKQYYILPSINDEQGKITKYMDKYTQYLLAKKNGIKMADSKILDLKKNTANDITFKKCILKPIVSATGAKSDIRICKNNEEKKKYLVELKEKGYTKILAQELIEFDTECGLIGCIDNGKIVLPGIIKKVRIYPQKRGSNSYANVEKLPKDAQIEKIKNLLVELKYSGMFDIEVFIKNNKIILNEINFRNSGNTFAYCSENVFIIYLWIMMKAGLSIDQEKTEIESSFSYIDEHLEFKQLLHRHINLPQFMSAKRKAKARLLHNRKDIKPSVFKVLYAIKKRI